MLRNPLLLNQLVFSPGGAEACSLGRKPQDLEWCGLKAPEGRKWISCLDDCFRPSGATSGIVLSSLGLAPQATCFRPSGAEVVKK